jgi:hypothetical protein
MHAVYPNIGGAGYKQGEGVMGEKEWAEGLSKGAFKNQGTRKKKKVGKLPPHRKTPKQGIRAKRMAKRRV